jgi:hypothetical protein
MALEEYVVVTEIASYDGRFIERTWNGAAAGANINDINHKTAKLIIVTAESAAEAILGVKQLYPTTVNDKCKAILLSSMTTG